MSLWRHTKSGNLYLKLPPVKLKDWDGKWVSAVAYTRAENEPRETFIRHQKSFDESFTEVTDHDPAIRKTGQPNALHESQDRLHSRDRFEKLQ